MSGSCVTSTMVSPSRLSRWSSARISTLVRVSRLPVGSSARITAGSLTSERALATRARGQARVEQRQLDVLQRAGAWQQIELLEDETDLAVAHARQFVTPEPRHVT